MSDAELLRTILIFGGAMIAVMGIGFWWFDGFKKREDAKAKKFRDRFRD